LTDLASLKATVRGRVQGVFFRSFVESLAKELKLTGYVCNLIDGTVEVRAEGERRELEKLAEYLKTGPPAARVEEVITEWAIYSAGYSSFKVT
jgi:acylphosphatase